MAVVGEGLSSCGIESARQVERSVASLWGVFRQAVGQLGIEYGQPKYEKGAFHPLQISAQAMLTTCRLLPSQIEKRLEGEQVTDAVEREDGMYMANLNEIRIKL